MLALTGCAWAPGTGFATLADAVVTVPAPLAAARLDAEGRWKTANGYRLNLDTGALRVTIADLALQAPGTASGGGKPYKLDPAAPPPGYGPCHGGHCHRADGSLADYADIEAELSAGTGVTPPATIVTLSAVDGTLALPLTQAAPTLSLGVFKPARYLPRTALSRAVVRLGMLKATGTVVPAAGGTPRRFTLDFAPEGALFAADVSAVASLTGPPGFALTGTLTLTDKLFDGLPFERLLATGTTELDLAADAGVVEVLMANLAKSTFTARLDPR